MRLLLIFITMTFFFSCSKEVKSNKRLSGSWTPVNLKVTDNSTGLSNAADASGTIIFDDDGKKTTNGRYDFTVNYNYKGNDCQLIEIGSYEIIEDQCFLTSDNSIETLSRIIYLNKEDFEFSIEKPGTNRLLFILKKN